jgi:hypothetical protein
LASSVNQTEGLFSIWFSRIGVFVHHCDKLGHAKAMKWLGLEVTHSISLFHSQTVL